MDVNAPEFTLSSTSKEKSYVDNKEADCQDLGALDGTHGFIAPQSSRSSISPVSMGKSSKSYLSQFAAPFVADEYRPTEEYMMLNNVVTDSGSNVSSQPGVSCLSFDGLEELLWMGNSAGHVTSYYGYQLQKYTSFQVHAINDIRHLLTGDFGLLSLTQNSLRLSIRRGLTVFTHSSELLKDMQCMTLLPSNLVLLGGHQKQLIEFDLERIKQVRITEIEEEGCVILRQHPKLVCCGDVAGRISIRDLNTLKVQHSFNTHSVTLSDFDVHGNYLVTCGYSNRTVYTPDRFLMVYDLRMFRQVAPIQMMFLPYLLRFVPAFSSRFCVVSQTGQFQLLDTSGSLTPPPFIHNVDLAPDTYITAFDVSSSCQALGFSDSAGYVYLYGASNEVVFNNFSQPTEFADPLEPVPSIAFDDLMTPFSTIPMPYYGDEKLLSDWPAELCQKTYRLPQPIDPQILNTMRMVGSIGYAPNPGNKRRNQMPYVTANSPKGRTLKSPNVNEINDVIPNRYQLVEPNPNKVILDEFAFGRFNHSPFCGLDSTLPNSYANNIIQMLYYITPLHVTILNHLCNREFCLTCELAFLFHMMNISPKQAPCQARNFLRAFRTIPEASALGLILPEDEELRRKVNFCGLSQSWIRFILHQLHSELSLPSNEVFETSSGAQTTSIITDLFGMEEICTYRCKCDHEWEQKTIKYPLTLTHPDSGHYTFDELLKNSIVAEQTMSAFCEKCHKFQQVIQNRSAASLPDVLTINCGLDNERSVQSLREQILRLTGEREIAKLPQLNNHRKACRYGDQCTRGDCVFMHEKSKESKAAENHAAWLPLTLYLSMDDGDLQVYCDKPSGAAVKYELVGVASAVKNGENAKENIVSCVRVDKESHKRREKYLNNPQSSKSEWYLFNHFSVNAVSPEEATHIDPSWKIPCLVLFARADINEKYKDSLNIVNPITSEVFSDDQSLAASGHRGSITFTPLSTDEMPTKADIVAMDAEFVTLNQEETEIRSDGTRATIKPPQRSVGRISCIRGSGLLEGQPFIDDYISTQEQVADFMTKFSGIQPGDLDVAISSKHLTTLKSTYLKLRFLIDVGVIFLGHGLKNDFRVINIVVPQEQIIDTVSLFQSPHVKRMVSLRFLAWHFLGMKIQSETHDSIEDAKAALKLYHKYQELLLHGRVDEAVEELYDAGRNSGWKVPGSDEN